MSKGRSRIGQILNDEKLLKILGENMSDFTTSFKEVQERMYQISTDHGFVESWEKFGEKIALTHSELSEALDYVRKGNGASDHIPEFLGVEEEFADTVIRLMSLSEGLGLRLAEAIEAKAEFNAGRPYKHGGKAF